MGGLGHRRHHHLRQPGRWPTGRILPGSYRFLVPHEDTPPLGSWILLMKAFGSEASGSSRQQERERTELMQEKRSREALLSYLASSSSFSIVLCLAIAARCNLFSFTFSLRISSCLCAWKNVFTKKIHILLTHMLSFSFPSSLDFSFFSGRKFH